LTREINRIHYQRRWFWVGWDR